MTQCCPMGVYGIDSAGNLRPECSCFEDCGCTCLNCLCPVCGEEYEL